MRFLPEKILVLGFVLALPALVIWKVVHVPKVLGVQATMAKDYSNEIAFWQNEIKLHPDYRDGYLKLAEAYKNSGDLEKARLFLQQALQLDPNLQLPEQLQSLQ